VRLSPVPTHATGSSSDRRGVDNADDVDDMSDVDEIDARSVVDELDALSGVPLAGVAPTPSRAAPAFFGLIGTKSTSFCSSMSARGLANGRRAPPPGVVGDRGGVRGEISADEVEVNELADDREEVEEVEREELEDEDSSEDERETSREPPRCERMNGEGDSGVGGNVSCGAEIDGLVSSSR